MCGAGCRRGVQALYGEGSLKRFPWTMLKQRVGRSTGTKFRNMALIGAREMRPKAYILIRQACINRLKKGAGERSTGVCGRNGAYISARVVRFPTDWKKESLRCVNQRFYLLSTKDIKRAFQQSRVLLVIPLHQSVSYCCMLCLLVSSLSTSAIILR